MAKLWSQNEITSNKRLFERGLQLYAQSEQSDFQNVKSFEEGLRFIVQAAQDGEEKAIRWIGTFYKTKPSHPTLTLPLESDIQRIAQQSEMQNGEHRVTTTLAAPHFGVKSTPSQFLEHEEQDVMMPKLMPSRSFSESEEEVVTTAKSMFSKMAGPSSKQTIAKGRIKESVQFLLSESAMEDESEWESSEGYMYMPSKKELQQSMASLMYSTLRQSASDEITEDDFCKTAVTLARGEVAAAQEVTQLSPQELEDFDKATVFRKVYKYPKQAFHFLKRLSFTTVEKGSTKWLWSIFPIQHFYFLLIAYFLPMLTVSFVVNCIAFAVFVGAFLVMSMATLEIFDKMEKISSSKKIASAFQYFQIGQQSLRKIETKAPEQQVQHSIGRYIAFILAFPSAIVALKMAQQEPVLMYVGIGLSIPSALFVVALFVTFQHYRTFFLISGTLHIIYMLSLLETPWSHNVELLFVSVRYVPILGISPRINLLTLVQLVVQLAVVAYIMKNKRNCLELVPCILFIDWLALCRNFLFRTDPDSFVGILWLISILFIALLSRPDLTHLKTTLQSLPLRHMLIIAIFISIPVIEHGGKWYLSAYNSCSSQVISMPEYAKRCGPQKYHSGNMIQTQLDCHDLKGCLFEARGTVKSVRIDHSHKNSLKSLPFFIRAILLRLFGDAKPPCWDQERAGTHIPNIFQYGNEYHLEIQLEMFLKYSYLKSPPISVSLTTTNCRVMKIEAGTELQFNSIFLDGMGSDKLNLKLTSWSIEGDRKNEEREDEEAKQHLPTHVFSSFENTTLFLFEMVVCCILLVKLKA